MQHGGVSLGANTNKVKTSNGQPYQYASIVPFANTPGGIQAAYNTPGYQNAAVNQYNYNAQNGGSTGGGGGSSGGGYGGSTGGAIGAQNLNPLKDQVTSKIQQIQAAYDLLNGNIGKSIQDQANRAVQNYGQQSTDLQKSYNTAADQMSAVYGARGLGDSSFYGNAQSDAGNTYQQGQSDITNAQNQTLAGLGQYGAQQQAASKSAIAQYQDLLGNLGQYDQAEQVSPGAGLTGLQSLYNTLGTNLSDAQTNAAGIGSNADFLKGLSQFTPVQNQASSQLAGKLQQLVTSSAPVFAKSQIAQGLVKQAQLTDPNAVAYWNNYYQNLLNGQG